MPQDQKCIQQGGRAHFWYRLLNSLDKRHRGAWRTASFTPVQRLIMSLSASWRQDVDKWICSSRGTARASREGFCAIPTADIKVVPVT